MVERWWRAGFVCAEASWLRAFCVFEKEVTATSFSLKRDEQTKSATCTMLSVNCLVRLRCTRLFYFVLDKISPRVVCSWHVYVR